MSGTVALLRPVTRSLPASALMSTTATTTSTKPVTRCASKTGPFVDVSLSEAEEQWAAWVKRTLPVNQALLHSVRLWRFSCGTGTEGPQVQATVWLCPGEYYTKERGDNVLNQMCLYTHVSDYQHSESEALRSICSQARVALTSELT
mmetsp:Transcript_162556/g.516420  ORF Transcript_162556/g.516420 Transcript_162556/m.516420 type:complete len:147 (-) Transcript_162556:190-630(-)